MGAKASAIERSEKGSCGKAKGNRLQERKREGENSPPEARRAQSKRFLIKNYSDLCELGVCAVKPVSLLLSFARERGEGRKRCDERRFVSFVTDRRSIRENPRRRFCGTMPRPFAMP